MKKVILFTLMLVCGATQILVAQTRSKQKSTAKKNSATVIANRSKKNAQASANATSTNTTTKFSPGLNVLPSGIRYQIVRKGSGVTKPKPGDYIRMHIRVYVSDSMAFDSYKLNDNMPVPSTISKPAFNGDIMEGLAMMVEGDSAVFEIAQDSVYRNGYTPNFAKPGDPVRYQIILVELRTKEQWELERKRKADSTLAIQLPEIKKYISDKGYKNYETLPNGLHVVYLTDGAGPLAVDGDRLSVNYTGMLMDGTVFDSNVMPEFKHVEPFAFTLGKAEVIKGWDQGFTKLREGGKAIFIIPSALAYGENGSPPRIAPNTVLVFGVELLDILNK